MVLRYPPRSLCLRSSDMELRGEETGARWHPPIHLPQPSYLTRRSQHIADRRQVCADALASFIPSLIADIREFPPRKKRKKSTKHFKVSQQGKKKKKTGTTLLYHSFLLLPTLPSNFLEAWKVESGSRQSALLPIPLHVFGVWGLHLFKLLSPCLWSFRNPVTWCIILSHNLSALTL